MISTQSRSGLIEPANQQNEDLKIKDKRRFSRRSWEN